MLLVCLAHFESSYLEHVGVPETTEALDRITRAATPTFILISGFVLAHIPIVGLRGALDIVFVTGIIAVCVLVGTVCLHLSFTPLWPLLFAATLLALVLFAAFWERTDGQRLLTVGYPWHFARRQVG